ncbi:hypothetical protein [Pumilibacter intestinalis]|uniref:hypothetical protein n=1 Tax=Pumilibacter intestinalis TaxID=2941511 RepID=UPI00203D5E9A|nr:hypothetical protein [Pumilibacter intestinalis]
MKKVISLFATLIITIMGLSFVGCSNDNTPTDTKIEYDLVKLTVDNYSDYIAINTDYSDYNLIALSESLLSGQYFYTASLIVHISTASAKPDLKFSNVKISYSVGTVSSTWELGNGILMPTARLDYQGNSKCSFTAIAENKMIGVLSPTIFSSTKNIVNTIDGFVYVPKES